MQIILKYAYTQAQIKKAYQFNLFPTPHAKFFLLFFTLSIFGIGSLFLLFWEPAKINALVLSILKYTMIVVCIFWSLTLFGVALNYFYMPIYAFKKNPFLKGNFTTTLNTEGLAYQQQVMEENIQGEASNFVKWEAFNKKAENEEFIILFIGRKQAIIPKTSFTTKEDLEKFRLFLTTQKHIKTKKFNGTKIWMD